MDKASVQQSVDFNNTLVQFIWDSFWPTTRIYMPPILVYEFNEKNVNMIDSVDFAQWTE
jgi:hypothetical protein